MADGIDSQTADQINSKNSRGWAKSVIDTLKLNVADRQHLTIREDSGEYQTLENSQNSQSAGQNGEKEMQDENQNKLQPISNQASPNGKNIQTKPSKSSIKKQQPLINNGRGGSLASVSSLVKDYEVTTDKIIQKIEKVQTFTSCIPQVSGSGAAGYKKHVSKNLQQTLLSDPHSYKSFVTPGPQGRSSMIGISKKELTTPNNALSSSQLANTSCQKKTAQQVASQSLQAIQFRHSFTYTNLQLQQQQQQHSLSLRQKPAPAQPKNTGNNQPVLHRKSTTNLKQETQCSSRPGNGNGGLQLQASNSFSPRISVSQTNLGDNTLEGQSPSPGDTGKYDGTYDENAENDTEISNGQNIFHGADEASQNANNIKVVIRVRPFNSNEMQCMDNTEPKGCVQIEKNGRLLILDKGGETKKFSFDFVGNQKIDQQSIFNHIAKPIADSCLQGYNGTIFAYGQTGAGKTFTIQGPSLFAENGQNSNDLRSPEQKKEDHEKRGIMQRSFEYIFQCIEAEQRMIDKKGNQQVLQFLVKCSFLEIYNEQIMDLLEPSSVNLQIREDINKGVYVEGLHEEIVGSHQEMFALIERGAKNRHCGATAMNHQSSRSHSVLTTIIESKSRSQTGVWNVKQSRFHIIDLAGSERQKVAHTVGDRLKEAGMINKSLSALGNVINSLVDVSEGKNRHVPYRDSKLTFILRDSLGGNSKTVIIANISPSHLNVAETHSTLKFAQRAKLIKNKAVINEDSSGTILLLKNEIKKLKKELADQHKLTNILETEKNVLTRSIQAFSPENNNGAVSRREHEVCKVCLKELDNLEDEEFNEGNLINIDQLEYSQNGDSVENEQNFKEVGCNDISLNYNSKQRSPKSGSLSSTLKVRSRAAIQVLEGGSNVEPLTTPQNLRSVARHLTSFTSYGSEPLAIKRINQLNERILAAENLLRKKLFLHVNAEKQIELLHSQNQKLQESTFLFEEDVQSLKALLAVKDQRISELEKGTDSENTSEQLKHEIEYLKEIVRKQVEKEHTPVVLKLQAQLEELNFYKVGALEVSPSVAHSQKAGGYIESLNQKVLEQVSMISDLNDYLNNKCSLQAFHNLQRRVLQLEESEKKMQISTEDLQQQYDILLDQNMKIEESSQKMTREYGRAQVELQSLRDQNNKMEGQIQSHESALTFLRQSLTAQLANCQTEYDEQKKSLDQEILNYKQELHTLDQQSKVQIESKNSEIRQLSETLKLQENKLLASEQRDTDLQKAIQNSENIVNQLRHDLSQNRLTITEKNETLIQKQEKINELTVAHNSSMKEIARKQEDLDQKNQQIELQELEINSKSFDLKIRNEEIDNSKETICDLRREIQILKPQAEKLEGLEQNLLLCIQEKESLQKELIQQQSQRDQLQLMLQASSANQECIRIELVKAQCQLDRKEQEQSEDLKSLQEKARLDSQNYQITLEQLRADGFVKEKLISEAKSAVVESERRLQEAIDRSAGETQKLNALLRELQQKETLLQSQICLCQQSEERNQALGSQIKNLLSDKQECEKNIEDLSALVSQLNESIEGSKQQASEEKESKEIEAQKKAQEWQDIVEEKILLMQQQQNQLRENSSEISLLKKELELVNQALENEKTDSKFQIDDLYQQLKEQQDQMEESKIEGCKQEISQRLQIDQLESQIGLLEKERQTEVASLYTGLQEECDNLRSQLKYSRNEIEIQSLELLSQQQALNQKQKEATEAAQKLEEQDRNIAGLHKKLVLLIQDAEAYLGTIKDQNSQIEDFRVKLSESEQQVQKKDEEIEKMNVQTEALSRQLDVGQEQIELIRNEKDKKMKELDTKERDILETLKNLERMERQANEEKNQKEQLLAQVQSVLFEAKQQQENLDCQIAINQQMQIENEEKSQENERLRATAEAQQRQLNIQNLEQKELLDQMLEKRRLLEELETRNSELSSKIRSEEAQLRSIQEELQQTKDTLDQNTKEMNEKLEQLKNETKAQKLLYQEQQLGHATEIDGIRLERKNLEQQLSDLQAHAEKQTSQLKQQYESELQELATRSELVLASALEKHTELQALRQQEYLEETARLRQHIQTLSEQEVDFLTQLEQIRATCYKKVAIISQRQGEGTNAQQPKITEILGSLQQLDDSVDKINQRLNDGGKASQATNAATEINLIVSQIVFDLTKVYERQLADVRAKGKGKLTQLKKDLQTIGEKYEKQKQENVKSKEEHTKLLGKIEQQESFQKEKLLAQRALLEKTVQDYQSQLSQHKVQLSLLKNQVKDAQIEAQAEKSALQSSRCEVQKLEAALKEELDQKQQVMTELSNYKIYLPEAESLLQEVNKRNQSAQKELDALMAENTKLKTQYQTQIQTFQAKFDKSKIDIEKEKHRHQESQEKMRRDRDSFEKKFEQVQEQVNALAQSSKQAEQDKEQGLLKNQELLINLRDAQMNERKLLNEVKLAKQISQKREQEMREVVKTLKQFAEDKKCVEKENERLKGDVILLSGAQSPGYKIQVLMKIKEENNKLKEENSRLQNELQKREQASQKSGRSTKQYLATEDVKPGTNTECPHLKHQVNMMIAHMKSLSWFSQLENERALSIESLPRASECFESRQLQQVFDLLSFVDAHISNLKQQPQQNSSENLNSRNKLTLQAYKTSSKLAKSRSRVGEGPHRGDEEPNVTVTNTSAGAILPLQEELLKGRRDNYFTAGRAEKVLHDETVEQMQDKTMDYLPRELVPGGRVLQSGVSRELPTQMDKMFSKNSQHHPTQASDHKQILGSLDQRGEKISYQCLKPPATVDTETYKRSHQGSLLVQGDVTIADDCDYQAHKAYAGSFRALDQENEEAKVISGQNYNIRSGIQPFNALASDFGSAGRLGSPIVLNSYSSIYRQSQQIRDQSRNSKASRASGGVGSLLKDEAIVIADRLKDKHSDQARHLGVPQAKTLRQLVGSNSHAQLQLMSNPAFIEQQKTTAQNSHVQPPNQVTFFEQRPISLESSSHQTSGSKLESLNRRNSITSSITSNDLRKNQPGTIWPSSTAINKHKQAKQNQMKSKNPSQIRGGGALATQQASGLTPRESHNQASSQVLQSVQQNLQTQSQFNGSNFTEQSSKIHQK